ncbi:hypothetical protein BCON_0011g00840 [Botryotinia convoluta]|uniref:Heterokaryon incompatibility domain-containing protein n=1 Tax=Botryotinia convoluta TaxID=54673 RepID=A0A4Z1IQH2_9HELO|nr:hypothetical protein BCON_0011g00840 [Botryotinia convoluta]
MAKIFGQANRVIVYLGDAADDSNQALESIRVAAEGESLNQGINQMNQSGIFELLKRPWFQRIWASQFTIDDISETTNIIRCRFFKRLVSLNKS